MRFFFNSKGNECMLIVIVNWLLARTVKSYLNTALSFVLILPSHFTYNCYPSGIIFWIPDCFLQISVRVITNIWYIILIAVDQILLAIKQLKQVTPCCINWLCLSLLCIKYMLSGHSAARVASKLNLGPSNIQLMPWYFQLQYSYLPVSGPQKNGQAHPSVRVQVNL